MAIHRLTMVSFRNHDQKEFEFSGGLTVIWGENGSGKTAVLEAIHTLSFGKSFRTHKQKSMIRNGDNSFIVKGCFALQGRRDEIAAQVNKHSGQKLKLNGKLLSGRTGIIGRNCVVVLSPEEQAITKGAPVERRKFFDKMFSVSNKDYVKTLKKYNRILKQRNAALLLIKENKSSANELKHWDKQLVDTGAKLWLMRVDLITQFKNNIESMIKRYDSSIQFEIGYFVEAPREETYRKQVRVALNTDLSLGRTTVGPHRDDVRFLWDKKNLRDFGSQGEHKLALVLLKLAEMCFIRDNTGSYPTLLLDDLFSKLDFARSQKIVSLLQSLEDGTGEPIQTIVTTTDILNVESSGLIEAGKETRTYHLERRCNT
jgi:DNA replication and repair protein RecF